VEDEDDPTMDELFSRLWGDLGDRIGGTMSFRLILQPAMAAFIAIRDGLADSRRDRLPFFWRLVRVPEQRAGLLRRAARRIARVFVLGLIMDAIFQFIAFRWFYPGEAVIVAVCLVLVPYGLIRALVGRLTRYWSGGLARPS
jgi:hypothetical protein